MAKLRVGVLISGSGSNLQALIDELHGREITIVGVCSNRADAHGLERARSVQIETGVFVDDQLAMADWFTERRAQLIVCAGYMRILSPTFLDRFPQRVINVHPSLLPAFPGAHAIEDTLAAGATETGVSVHLVDDGVDTGHVIEQERVPVHYGETADALRTRIHGVEHRLLPAVVRQFAKEA